MDKGVRNHHKSHITVSGREGAKDLVLKPGLNRLTEEQYRQIRAVKVVNNYFEAGLLSDATPPEQPAAGKPEGDPNAKPLDKMNKEELIAKATELGVTVEPDDTKAVILKKIQDAAPSA